ncbi:MAG: hypothetical protein ABJ092_13815 [Gillisia sp.]
MKPKQPSKTGKTSRRSKTDPLNMDHLTPLRDHDNSVVRFFAKTGYTVWIIVMVVGLILAFIVSLFLV